MLVLPEKLAASHLDKRQIEPAPGGKQVVDATQNTAPGTEKGYTHKFDATKTRYVRVNMLKNSDNLGVHLVEVRVFEVEK